MVPFVQGHSRGMGNTLVGAMQQRSKDVMPGFSKDMNVLQKYAKNITKAYTDNMAGLRGTMLIDKFQETNAIKDVDQTNAWANYMKDSLQTMLGLNTFRSLEIHGIKKSEVKVLQQFIDQDLELKHKLPYKHRRFIKQVEEYICSSSIIKT